MKSIYLESVLAFIFVGVMAMLICGLFYNDYRQQPYQNKTEKQDYAFKSIKSTQITA